MGCTLGPTGLHRGVQSVVHILPGKQVGNPTFRFFFQLVWVRKKKKAEKLHDHEKRWRSYTAM